MKVCFVGHSHHRVTQSYRFFFDILNEIGEVESVWDETWRGDRPVEVDAIDPDAELIVVWQSVAYVKRIAELNHPNVVYVPMYDASKDLRRSFWAALKRIKILNFSSALHQRVQQFGCRNSAYIQYFPNPADSIQITDFETLRGFLWQRQMTPGWTDIRPMLGPDFSAFHLHLAADPGIPVLAEPSGSDQRNWNLEVTRWFPEKSEMLKKLRDANVYFAPRLAEGIGLSFLEAMAMGIAVCAPDTPTHNEYIVDGVNGFLYATNETGKPDWSRAREAGARARDSVELGFRRWTADRDRLLDFLTQPSPDFQITHYARPTPASTPEIRARGLQTGVAGEGGKRRSGGSATAPRITVATVVRNAPAELAKTLASITSQTYADKEVLVIDGGSDDSTLEVLSAFEPDIDYWRSEPDQGPYDAMNKAADLARGHWIMYINAGDAFVDDDALNRFLSDVPDDADFVAGHHVYLAPDGCEHIHRCVDFEQTFGRLLSGRTDGRWLSGIPGHQSVATRVALIRQHRYDAAYRIAADHEFMYRMRRMGASFFIQPVIVSQYVGGGLSSRNVFRCLQEWRAIALRYTEQPDRVRRAFQRLLVDTLRHVRRNGPFAWRQEPARSHFGWAVLAEVEYQLRRVVDWLDACHARTKALKPRRSRL